jgi:1-acyl-sn-glycerol-3-phosphate acyltransferase
LSRLHKPKAGSWIRFCVSVIYPLDSLLFRIRWRHLDRMTPPADGGVIVAINHVSHIDTLLMARLMWQSGRIPRFLVKASLFSKPGLGQIMRGAQQIPVYRGTTDAADSLRAAVDALGRGEAVVIYPEGTITKDPAQWPMQGKTGIARLWLLAPDTPVIAVGQWGAQKRGGPIGQRLRRRDALGSVAGPVDLSRFRGAPDTAETVRAITDTIMTAVRDEVAELRQQPAPAEFFVPEHKYVDRA